MFQDINGRMSDQAELLLNIHRRDEFLRHNIQSADQNLNLALLIETRSDGLVRDHFRCHLFGKVMLTTLFPAEKLFVHEAAKGIYLHYEAYPHQAQPDFDATTSAWMDVQDMVQSGYIALTDGEGSPVLGSAFKDVLRNNCDEKDAVGAAIRWAVTVNSRQQLELSLQSLPTPAKLLKPAYKEDNVATVRLAKIPLVCHMGNGTSWSGPVPLLFSPDQAATQAAFQQDPGLAKRECNKVLARFLHMEHFTIAEAVAYLKKFRPAAGVPVYKNVVPEPEPAAKKYKSEPTPVGAPAETGGRICFQHIQIESQHTPGIYTTYRTHVST